MGLRKNTIDLSDELHRSSVHGSQKLRWIKPGSISEMQIPNSSMNSYLEKLIGKKLENVNTGISQTYALGVPSSKENSLTLIFTTIFFEDYILGVYNRHEIISHDYSSIADLIGLRVTDAHETKNFADIIFTQSTILRIDLRDEAFIGPEALTLSGTDGRTIVVWN